MSSSLPHHARRVYRFRAVLPAAPGRGPLWCEVDLLSTQTLADLAAALLQPFSLDSAAPWSFVIGALFTGDERSDDVQTWSASRAARQLLRDVAFPGLGGWDEFLLFYGPEGRLALRVWRISVDAGIEGQAYPRLIAGPGAHTLSPRDAAEPDAHAAVAAALGHAVDDAAAALKLQEATLRAMGHSQDEIARVLAPLRRLHARLIHESDQHVAQDVWTVLLPPTS